MIIISSIPFLNLTRMYQDLDCKCANKICPVVCLHSVFANHMWFRASTMLQRIFLLLIQWSSMYGCTENLDSGPCEVPNIFLCYYEYCFTVILLPVMPIFYNMNAKLDYFQTLACRFCLSMECVLIFLQEPPLGDSVILFFLLFWHFFCYNICLNCMLDWNIFDDHEYFAPVQLLTAFHNMWFLLISFPMIFECYMHWLDSSLQWLEYLAINWCNQSHVSGLCRLYS
ncbi:hypothetical protein Ancab_025613 [Ancistrocladus abbreviatus]